MREIRSFKAAEMRVEKSGDGKVYLSGYAATFQTLSHELRAGGVKFRERIQPGAFTRALKERQDVRHLQNHSPNLILGRTKAGTTELFEDEKGLRFRTLLPDTGYARDLAACVERGDIDECSFAFDPVKTEWSGERGSEIRDLTDVDLYDISTVTYPAYPNTSAGVERSMFPEGVPVEIRSRGDRAPELPSLGNLPADERAAAWNTFIELAGKHNVQGLSGSEEQKPGALRMARQVVESATARLVEQSAKTVEPEEQCAALCRICRDIADSVIWYCYGAGEPLYSREMVSALTDCCYACNFCAVAVSGESASRAEIAGLCALICNRTAEACAQFADDAVMKACADACAACSACCQAMAAEDASEDAAEGDEEAGAEMRRQRLRLALASC